MKPLFSEIYFKEQGVFLDNRNIIKHVDTLLDMLCERVSMLSLSVSERYNTEKENEKVSHDEAIVNFKRKFNFVKNKAPSGVDEKIPPKESIFAQINSYLTKVFPEIEGDSLIQIGTTFHKYGQSHCHYKHVITLDTCASFEGVDEIVQCETEEEVLLAWTSLIKKMDPDVMTGYNIYGFDMKYMFDRSEELGCTMPFCKLGRYSNHSSSLITKTLTSSALGENIMHYIDMEGRISIDLMKVVQRDHNLDSYKLDNVASHFIKGKVKSIDGNVLTLDSVNGINSNDYISIKTGGDDAPMKVFIRDINVDSKQITLDMESVSLKTLQENDLKNMVWGLAKDDVSPNEIFRCQKGSSIDRAKIAKYCVQDCSLCNIIIIKLEIIANNIGMSNVCCVPLSYIFMRGQGVKIFSLVSKQCRADNTVIPVVKPKQIGEIADGLEEEEEGYEGAIVLTPKPGMHIDEPISVMDYASLYPSSMISENISHDSLVLDSNYDNMPGVEYVDITYDVYEGKADKKRKVDEKVCRFAQFPDNKKGILPRILMDLLKQRKATRKRISEKDLLLKDSGEILTGYIGKNKTDDGCIHITLSSNLETIVVPQDNVASVKDTHNDFMKAVLDGLQLAYKVTANSLYGQVGARTSPIYLKELAASTTATGRNLIMTAKKFMEEKYDSEIIYGDTDSIFVNFRLNEKLGLTGKEAIKQSIELAVQASKEFKAAFLKDPHELEYEKTFYPFIILSKKKYVGNLYEYDCDSFKQKSMGIVLKRRDNANIVKYVYGGMIDIILNECNLHKAVSFLKQSLKELVAGKFPLSELVITKTLRSEYKDPTKIAHKVLADRMGERDPGSKPQVNDRIPFVYIECKNAHALQGEKIEFPGYIKEKGLKPDYAFYISNQLMKPICQLLSLVLEQMQGYTRKNDIHYFDIKEKMLFNEKKGDVKKVADKLCALRMQEVENLIFKPMLKQLEAKKNGMMSLDSWIIKK
jgi:DNA polymerase elongation subunit (family B)